MMPMQFLKEDEPLKRTMSYLIGNSWVQAPSFIPEIKGEEDVDVLLRHTSAQPQNNPVIVPANKWPKIINNPKFVIGDTSRGVQQAQLFLENHPIIFFDPPELFRYTMGNELIKYSLRGDKKLKSLFVNLLKKNDKENALKLADPIFRPFIERQWNTIFQDLKIDIGQISNEENSGHIEKAWLDPRVDESYVQYMLNIGNSAIKMPNSTIIPPVPPLMKSSNRAVVSRIVSSNNAASVACQYLSNESKTKYILPYFHLYMDSDIVENSTGNNINTALKILEDGLNKNTSQQFSGIAITVNGYDKLFESDHITKFKMLINDAIMIGNSHSIPTILPRSTYYGLPLLDYGIRGYSSMMNGSLKYSKGGFSDDPDDKFGKVYLIDQCVELKKRDVIDYIRKNGQFPTIPGLPLYPTSEELLHDKLYRLNWSKPRKLSCIEEAKRIRKAQEKGIVNPAKLYINNSSNKDLNRI
ncbi:MAG: hypothetical protein ABR999_06280 [Methanoregula sp.]|jgi:hypothetical protein|uniref:hypothetical protein n=1 Tax=Methanoregula sp. TaxID=2052170 RepID=UPI003D0E8CAA